VKLPQRDYPILANFTAVAAIPARYALERADWAGAAALPVSTTGRAMADSLTRFARGLGMARSGDLAGAQREVQALQELRSALEQSSQSYWADRTQEQILAVAGWVAYAEGARDQAAQLMRAAPTARMAASSMWRWRTDCTRCATCSAELLLQIGQPAAALGEFAASLKENPNRYRGLSGAARAAEAAGDRQKASRTSRSSSRCPARPTRRVRNWHTRRPFSGGGESRRRRAMTRSSEGGPVLRHPST
jgi:predicted Zn-dependent protease